ncbi:MAG: hypothetical protein QF362_01765 [Candidatus Woesearchaeota archaeon]|nr:hypothetical protein [Candidatus Woesearchaeota archaeon]MDP7506150.1 hypothetical protein [Candidatus Woesearchaeota archaeon]MDP7610350.1 hypothetical protein [Candidatus Woesearchaeota archaeon]
MIKIKKYIIMFGGVVIVLTLMLSFLSGLYGSYITCKDVVEVVSLDDTPESAKELQENNKLVMECKGVMSDVYLSYFFLGLGTAILVGGFITMKLK